MQDGINNNKPYAFNSRHNNYSYMYYSNSNSAYPALTSWYDAHLSSYSDKITVGDYFCEQAKVKSADVNISGNAEMEVYTSYIPNFKCETDGNGYGIINSGVGLITYDEVVFAGGYPLLLNDSYYLNNNSELHWWTMSPAGQSSLAAGTWGYHTTMGFCGFGTNYPSTIVRAVINLKSDVTVMGSGTIDDPYVVQ